MKFAEGTFVQHVKTKSVYVILRQVTMESTGEPGYVYIGKKGDAWVRPATEMEDGRFIEYRHPKGIHEQIKMTKHHILTMPQWARSTSYFAEPE